MLGIFDSGFGGLNVLRAIRDVLPDHAVLYLGDSVHLPYGEKDRETITRYTKECCMFLFERGCSLVVLACNAASADTLRELQQSWLPTLQGSPKNIIGVVRPIAEEAVLLTRNNRIGVVGTRATVRSEAYVRELQKLRPTVTVIQQACPLLVPLVEEGWVDKPETRRILRTYLYPLKSQNPDVLILGCTHYEALHALFRRKMGQRCSVLHSPSVIATKLVEYLQRHPEYDSAIPHTGKVSFLTTGDPVRFREVGERFFGSIMGEVERVRLSQ